MSKEQQELVYEAYDRYCNTSSMYFPIWSQEQFINKCKTNTEFSEKWKLTIEERELSMDERMKLYEGEFTPGIEVTNDHWLNSKLTTRNIPTKLITIKYNDKTIESYE